MELQTYLRIPFAVEAIQLTEENMEEVAKLVGEVMTDEQTGERYIRPDRSKVTFVKNRCRPGCWFTFKGGQIQHFPNKAFTKSYVSSETPKGNLLLGAIPGQPSVDPGETKHNVFEQGSVVGVEPVPDPVDTFDGFAEMPKKEVRPAAAMGGYEPVPDVSGKDV